MKIFSRSKLILALVIVVVLSFPLVASAASSQDVSNGVNAKRLSGMALFGNHLFVRPAVSLGSHTIFLSHHNYGHHYLYVDAGSSTDSIDAYLVSNTLIHIGNFPTGGGISSTFYGTQDIAVTRANSQHGPCLVYTDYTNGYVKSFPINADGSLGAMVSSVPNTHAGDVHISQNGKLVYVASEASSAPPTPLSSYLLGAHCSLYPLVRLVVAKWYISFALASSTRLVTVDSNSGTIDTYTLTQNGGISFLNAVPGQIDSFPDSVAVQSVDQRNQHTTKVFTGQATGGTPLAQGGRETLYTGGISFLSGSPATDPNGVNGAAVIFDANHSLLVQGEQGGEGGGNTLGVYSVGPSWPGSLAFLEQTPLNPSGGGQPTAFALLGETLFVAAGENGDVETCLINNSGVSGCATAATLTDPTGFEGGIVVL
jgi:hypothetical protein